LIRDVLIKKKRSAIKTELFEKQHHRDWGLVPAPKLVRIAAAYAIWSLAIL